jgi:hypothetical protein
VLAVPLLVLQPSSLWLPHLPLVLISSLLLSHVVLQRRRQQLSLAWPQQLSPSSVSSLICVSTASLGVGQVSSQNLRGKNGMNFLYSSTCLMGRIPGGFKMANSQALIANELHLG